MLKNYKKTDYSYSVSFAKRMHLNILLLIYREYISYYQIINKFFIYHK